MGCAVMENGNTREAYADPYILISYLYNPPCFIAWLIDHYVLCLIVPEFLIFNLSEIHQHMNLPWDICTVGMHYPAHPLPMSCCDPAAICHVVRSSVLT